MSRTDALTEQLVRKKKDVKYYLNVFLIILAAIAIPATLIVFAYLTGPAYLVYLALFAAMFTIYGAWFFITSLRIDYEYAFLSSTLRIDRIIAKRRRKPVVKVDVKKLEDFFPYSDEAMSAIKPRRIFRAADNEFSAENHVAVYHDESKRLCAIIFTPNEEFISAMKPFFNNELKKKMMKEKRY
jgi:hypothetical protein